MSSRRKWIDVCQFCGKRADTNIPPIPPATAWVGVCMACNKARGLSEAYNAWRTAKIAADKAELRQAGHAAWAAKGIAVGDAVRVYGQNLFGRFPIIGTAKVGTSGAYVLAPKYGRLSPHGAERVS